jgi:DNA modification methylase
MNKCLQINSIICGNALTELEKLPSASVDCVVTSPPYYLQRNYDSHAQQLGQEQTPAEYVRCLNAVFNEIKRVLKPTGTCWVIIGDKYQNGELLGMPWRLALTMKDAGWLLRADCIWHKPNAMPASTKSRPTVDHEYIFFFSKSADYFYNANAIREPHVTFSDNSKMKGGRQHFFKRGSTPEAGKNGGQANLHNGRWDQAFHPLGRNKRTVWSISLSKNRDAHFAVFPESLVKTCILAGCPENGLVLDPFMGSGTTALVAENLGRAYLGIDCVAEYCAIARRRLQAAKQPPTKTIRPKKAT